MEVSSQLLVEVSQLVSMYLWYSGSVLSFTHLFQKHPSMSSPHFSMLSKSRSGEMYQMFFKYSYTVFTSFP